MKHSLLVPGLIALTLSALPVIPAIAQTETVPTAPQQRRQGVRQQLVDKLNLTAEQKAQMQTIQANAKTEMQKILTDAQKTQIESARTSGQKGGLKNLNLTADQQAQMKALREATRQQIDAVLTDAQRATLQQMKQNRGQKRGQNGANGGFRQLRQAQPAQ